MALFLGLAHDELADNPPRRGVPQRQRPLTRLGPPLRAELRWPPVRRVGGAARGRPRRDPRRGVPPLKIDPSTPASTSNSRAPVRPPTPATATAAPCSALPSASLSPRRRWVPSGCPPRGVSPSRSRAEASATRAFRGGCRRRSRCALVRPFRRHLPTASLARRCRGARAVRTPRGARAPATHMPAAAAIRAGTASRARGARETTAATAATVAAWQALGFARRAQHR